MTKWHNVNNVIYKKYDVAEILNIKRGQSAPFNQWKCSLYRPQEYFYSCDNDVRVNNCEPNEQIKLILITPENDTNSKPIYLNITWQELLTGTPEEVERKLDENVSQALDENL